MKQKKSNKVTENHNIKKERRTFLKKAVYKAPALIVLGSLASPKTAMAGDSGVPGTGTFGGGL